MKQSLNLPKTKFSMKANLAQREPDFIKFWDSENVYEKMQQCEHLQGSYILNDGPPYANGSIHIGHSVNKILKDIIIKSQHFSGKRAPYIPGWDCHGLPIEVQVEKKFGRGKLTPSEFRAQCRLYAKKQVEGQKKGFQRLGVFGDWNNSYLTMQPSFEANIVKQFLSMVEKGAITSGLRPIHWCAHCQSALSDAETEFQDKVSKAIDVAFGLTQPLEIEGTSYQSYVPIWTTTPWTIPANQAVAYSENLDYAAYVIDDKAYILSTTLASQTLQRWNIDKDQIIAERSLTQEELKELKWATHPLYGRVVPVIIGDHVTDLQGTGFVHVAPDHGPEDYELGHAHGLTPLDLLDDRGIFREGVVDLAGLQNFEAQTLIIEKLAAQGSLKACEDYSHSYPVCWRHKKPIFFRTTPQWFVQLSEQFKGTLIEQAGKVSWHPDWGQARMENMIAHRPHWCISRQRHWGTPLVLIYDKQTYEIHPQMQQLGQKVVQAIEEKGIEAWFDSTLQTWGIQEERWVKSSDTLDVWFDSGSVFHLLAQQPLSFPADLYLEGNDQYRGWFQSSLINSVAYHGQAPYKAILTHGMVVDSQGKKMSKSLGNVVEPDKVAQKYGIDVLRLWVAMSDYRQELAIGDEILDRTADIYRRLRNTLRFFLGNLDGFQIEKDLLSPEQCTLVDRQILYKLARLQDQNKEHYHTYRFDAVARSVVDFCVNDLGANYLDMIKDRLYTSHRESQARRSAQTALYYLFESLVIQLAPILSFTAEDAWQNWPLAKSRSVFLQGWAKTESYANAMTDKELQIVDQALGLKKKLQLDLESLRQKGIIGSALEAHCHLVFPKDHGLLALQEELTYILLVSKVSCSVDESSEEISWTITSLSDVEKCERCWFRLPLSEEKLCARCQKNMTEGSEVRTYA